MKQEGNSDKTINQYCYEIRQLSNIDNRLYRLSNIEIQDYILSKKSFSAQNISINAIKKFYKYLYPSRKIKVLIRPKSKRTLPVVLNIEEIRIMLNTARNSKHKAIILTLFDLGVRLSELLNLKWSDIDRKNMSIRVNCGKGGKDRVVPMTKRLIKCYEEYYRDYPHLGYIFDNNGNKYSSTSVSKVVKYCSDSIDKNVTPHILRHTFATSLMNNGTDIRIIQSILGHEKSTTTEIYTHISNVTFNQIKRDVI